MGFLCTCFVKCYNLFFVTEKATLSGKCRRGVEALGLGRETVEQPGPSKEVGTVEPYGS